MPVTSATQIEREETKISKKGTCSNRKVNEILTAPYHSVTLLYTLAYARADTTTVNSLKERTSWYVDIHDIPKTNVIYS
jgi:hypothetical protein